MLRHLILLNQFLAGLGSCIALKMCYFCIVYGDTCKSFFRSGVFDSLDKAFCILRLDSTGLDPESSKSKSDNPTMPMDLIRRVDLIISPPDQYPFALVSWTGSKVILSWTSRSI